MKRESFINKILMILRIPIDIVVTVINTILLSIVYLIGIGVTAIIARISGKRFLECNRENALQKKTFWKKIRKEKNDFLRSF